MESIIVFVQIVFNLIFVAFIVNRVRVINRREKIYEKNYFSYSQIHELSNFVNDDSRKKIEQAKSIFDRTSSIKHFGFYVLGNSFFILISSFLIVFGYPRLGLLVSISMIVLVLLGLFFYFNQPETQKVLHDSPEGSPQIKPTTQLAYRWADCKESGIM